MSVEIVYESVDSNNNDFFERVLQSISEWREVVMEASKIFEVDPMELRKALEYLDSLEEEVLRLSIFY